MCLPFLSHQTKVLVSVQVIAEMTASFKQLQRMDLPRLRAAGAGEAIGVDAWLSP